MGGHKSAILLPERCMKKFFVVLFVTGILGRVFCQNGNDLGWSMVLVDPKKEVSVSFSRPVAMKTGDAFSFIIQSDQDAYCYVVVQDSERNTIVLHGGRILAGKELNLGPLTLTPPAGTETFYVVMSLGEQQSLAAAIKGLGTGGRQRAGRRVMNEVFGIRRQVSALRENPEKPVFMGGAFRGAEAAEGRAFSGADTYVKTITISH
jgi:hypothetical protein